MTIRRRVLALGTTLAGASSLAGFAAACSGPGGDTGAAPVATVGPATIRFTYWGADPEEVSIEDRVIAAFQQKQPQIRVENAGDSAGTGPYHEKLVAQAAAGTWNDVGRIQSGGDYYNAQLTKCTIAEPAAVEGVQFMVDLIQKHRVWPAPSQGTTGLQWFPGATIGMQIGAITGSWQWRQDPNFEFDVVTNPKGKAGQIGRLNANGYGVFSGSKAQNAAWEFLKHLASAETLALLASLGRSFPWRRSVAQSKEYRDQQPIKSVDVIFKLAEKGKSWPIVPAWNETERFANPIFKDMGDGKVSVRDGLERIRAEADRLLAT